MKAIEKLLDTRCPHELGIERDTNKNVSDYKPLTKPEISALLSFARENNDDCFLLAKVQVRLSQGITGMTCPRPIKGTVAVLLKILDSFYVNDFPKLDIVISTNIIYAILN